MHPFYPPRVPDARRREKDRGPAAGNRAPARDDWTSRARVRGHGRTAGDGGTSGTVGTTSGPLGSAEVRLDDSCALPAEAGGRPGPSDDGPPRLPLVPLRPSPGTGAGAAPGRTDRLRGVVGVGSAGGSPVRRLPSGGAGVVERIGA